MIKTLALARLQETAGKTYSVVPALQKDFDALKQRAVSILQKAVKVRQKELDRLNKRIASIDTYIWEVALEHGDLEPQDFESFKKGVISTPKDMKTFSKEVLSVLPYIIGEDDF